MAGASERVLHLPAVEAATDEREDVRARVRAALTRALAMAEADLGALEKAREMSVAQGEPAWEHGAALRQVVSTLRTCADGITAISPRDPRPRGGK